MKQNKWIHLSLGLIMVITSLVSVSPAAMQDTLPASIDLEKYISVDGGVTWLDADGVGPTINTGEDVLFRVFVTNTGEADLTNLVLTDTAFDVATCSVPETLGAGSFFGCDFGPVEAVEGDYVNTATITADSESGQVTDSDSAAYTGEVDEDGDDNGLDIVISIEGPVVSIDVTVGIIVIYGIEIHVDPTDPILIALEIGDNVRVEGAVDEADTDGTTIVIVAVTVVVVDVEIYIGGDGSDGGPVYRDDGNCNNPPPAWAPAWGWRRKCEGVEKPGKKGK